jgi:RNA polymerase sigma-70 factor (ECF subfamily)
MHLKAKPKMDLNSAPVIADGITDEDLWRAFQNREDAAFTMLYGRYSDRVYSYLKLLMSGSRRHLDDIFQDAWLQLFKSRDAFEASAPGAVSAWIFRLAHNMAVSQLRRKPPISIEDLNVDTDLIEGFTTPAVQEQFDQPNSEAIMAHVMKSVEHLPILLREVFILSEFNGLGLDQIAETLGVSKQNVKVRLFLARRVIREDLARDFEISGIADAA